MGFIIGILTFVLVLDCLALIFLVLIQLPKKEAGAGLAFGGAATDALFGAGSGTVLTKITKYAATIFFVLAIVLALMQRHYQGRRVSEFQRQLDQPGKAPAGALAPAPAPNPGVLTNPAVTTPADAASNAARVIGSNVPPPTAESSTDSPK